MDFSALVPMYQTAATPRRKSDAQQQAEWDAAEADKKHREKVREYKFKKIIEADIWIPKRFRISRRKTDASAESDMSSELSPTTIRWADTS
ncbi:hypothetical protein EV178_002001 [Coemansia sp. RSA 1646]|nr:hypothetical protein EV178_002001 [Coemansia sp. RSA 1646]KAJ2090776.1 hypothetical protein IW138_002394 [Coemansia sp. RSA 986]KAJ2216024.1 hypothetical protein EV179_001675 [Coemansia sp. RSA 487]